MMVWKMFSFFHGCILRFHINLPGCTAELQPILMKHVTETRWVSSLVGPSSCETKCQKKAEFYQTSTWLHMIWWGCRLLVGSWLFRRRPRIFSWLMGPGWINWHPTPPLIQIEVFCSTWTMASCHPSTWMVNGELFCLFVWGNLTELPTNTSYSWWTTSDLVSTVVTLVV